MAHFAKEVTFINWSFQTILGQYEMNGWPILSRGAILRFLAQFLVLCRKFRVSIGWIKLSKYFFSFWPFLEIRFWSLLYKKAKLFWLWYKKWATRRVKVMELGWGMWLKWLTPRTFNPLLVAFKPRWPITPLSYKPPKTHWPNECNKNRMSGSQDADSRKNHYRGD